MTTQQPATPATPNDVPSLPWGQIADTSTTLGVPTPIPDAYRTGVAQVCAAIHQNLPAAGPLARRLEQDLADRHGRSHPYALSAHELVAHHHYQTRDYVHATELYLALAESWRKHLTNRHPYVRQVVKAAHCAWCRIEDPRERDRLRPGIAQQLEQADLPPIGNKGVANPTPRPSNRPQGLPAGPPPAGLSRQLGTEA